MPIFSSPLDLMPFRGRAKYISVALHDDKTFMFSRQDQILFNRISLSMDAQEPVKRRITYSTALYGECSFDAVPFEKKSLGPFWNCYVYSFVKEHQHYFITTDGESLALSPYEPFARLPQLLDMIRAGITLFDIHKLVMV